MHTVLILLSLFCTGWSKDLTIGNAEGRKIFDEVRQASPAIWRQYENVTVIAPDNELISKVVITDMRPEKDGDVQILDGGDGQKSVSIELKSPTVLRGYEFRIEVYSLPDTVATDAEEHLYNEAVSPAQGESTELPGSAKDNHDDETIQSTESTEIPNNANSKDIKDFPTLTADDQVDADSTRPARETEENNSQTDVPEDEITSSYGMSNGPESISESEDTSLSQNDDESTELPETPIEDEITSSYGMSNGSASTSESEEDTSLSQLNDDESTELPETPIEDEITSSYGTSNGSESTSESEEDTSLSQNDDESTQLPETPIEDGAAGPVNPDNIRAARETELVTSEIASAPPAIDSTEDELNFATPEAASETLVTDATTEVSDDATTTEAVITISPYEQSTFTPISYFNSENVANQAQPVDILDYIKNREALRPIRHTEEEEHEVNMGPSELSVQNGGNNDYTTPLADETSSMKPDDDTADLSPPEINASFNSDFADPGTTVIPIEGTTLNNVPRAGRGIDFDSSDENESTPAPTISETDEESSTTASPLNADVTTPSLDEDHVIASSDDQLRNTRGASKDIEDESDANISEDTSQGNMQNDEVISSGEADENQPNRKLIIINLDEFMARAENNKFAYALPIVLIINSENNNNYPIIKIIAEDASNDRDNSTSNELLPTLPSDISLEPAEYEGMENDRIKGDTSSGDYDHSQ